MKTNRLLFLGLLLLAGTAQAQATFSIGPALGGCVSTQHNASQAITFRYHLDWLAGAQASVDWSKFAVQPALLFSQKGYKYDYVASYQDANNLPLGDATIHNNIRQSYLTLPVNFVFAPQGVKKGPQLFAGPYASILLGARNVHTDTNNLPTATTVTDHLVVVESLSIYSNQLGFRRFDAGLQGGVGYRYEAWLLQASYSLGLRNTAPNYTYVGTLAGGPGNYTRAFQLSAAYLLSQAK